MDKIDFVNGEAPYINAENLNGMQNNIENAFNEKCSYIKSSGTATSTASSLEEKNVCSITLNKGQYLVLTKTESTVSSEVYKIITRLAFDSQKIGELAGGGTFRGIMSSGGGLAGWALINVTTDNSILNLNSYVLSDFNIRGSLCAIKL